MFTILRPAPSRRLFFQGMRERVPCPLLMSDLSHVASVEDGRKEAVAAAAFLMINESLVAFSEVTHHGKQLRSELGLGDGEGRGRRRRRRTHFIPFYPKRSGTTETFLFRITVPTCNEGA